MRSAHPGISAPIAHIRRARILAIAAGAAAAALLPVATRADGTLEEIVVTAQRRVERLQDVPVAITALSALDLESRGVRQAGDIVATVPNLVLSSPYGEEAQPTFSLRGITTNDWSENQSSPIAMYVDDVYKSVGAIQALQVYDLDRVEVLRGPQGTLYGKNATGGALNFYSKNPSLTQYDGYLTAGVGNYSAYSMRGAVGGPIVDNELGWRAAVLYDKRDGWVRSVVPGVEPLNGVDALAARFSLLYKPSADLTTVLKIAVSRSGGTPYGVHSINIDPTPYAVDGTGTGFSGSYNWFSNGSKYAIHKSIDSDGLSLRVDWQLSDHYTLTSVTGYDYGRWYEKSDDGGLWKTDAGTVIHTDDPNTYFSSVTAVSQELRIASHDTGPFGWLAGAYYGRDSAHVNLQFHFYDTLGSFGFVDQNGNALQGFDTYNDFNQIRVSKALFFNANYALRPNVTLRAGVRYTKDTISIENFYALNGGLSQQPTSSAPDTFPTLWTQTIPLVPLSFVNYYPSLAPQGATTPGFGRDSNNVSVKAGADWKVSEDVLAYLSFSQGYRGHAFNGQAYYNDGELTFASPEKLNSYEIGVKSELLERRLELNAAAFYYAYRDQQFLDTYCAFPPTPPATACLGFGFKTRNAPKSRVTGAELELRAKPTAALELRASIGVVDSKYEELFLHFADRSGNKLIMAPDLTVGLLADWRAAQLAAGELHFAITANYTGKQYFDALNTERIAQSGYSVVNARVSLLGDTKQRFSVAAWGKNLTNRQYLAYALPQRNPTDSNLGFDYALVGEPRTYGLEATYRF